MNLKLSDHAQYLQLREIFYSVLRVGVAAIVGLLFGWLWAFIVIAALYLHAMLALATALAAIYDGKADGLIKRRKEPAP